MKDIILDNSYDLEISNGDFVVSTSDSQHQACLLLSDKNGIKEHPLRGVGILNFINDDNSDGLLRETRMEFIADGMTVKRISANGGKINVEAQYE